jgi:hypothetical protein
MRCVMRARVRHGLSSSAVARTMLPRWRRYSWMMAVAWMVGWLVSKNKSAIPRRRCCRRASDCMTQPGMEQLRRATSGLTHPRVHYHGRCCKYMHARRCRLRLSQSQSHPPVILRSWLPPVTGDCLVATQNVPMLRARRCRDNLQRRPCHAAEGPSVVSVEVPCATRARL